MGILPFWFWNDQKFEKGVCGDPGGNDRLVAISGEIQRLVLKR